ncbi:hypothetical protein DPMN_054097 [Dreissena polymorpha]|uniref:Uncharacterized protein n=1 Tax=Dreissena polymorpha TaxID=45954 RepID=A0A9D4CPW8_DREPO|nr:hypothetical protein DPMN_054097 [Dreissena polymorpha]
MERRDLSRSNATNKCCGDLESCPQTERGRRRSRGQTTGEQSDIADPADPQQYVQVSRRRRRSRPNAETSTRMEQGAHRGRAKPKKTINDSKYNNEPLSGPTTG